jgi:hypothetical protein
VINVKNLTKKVTVTGGHCSYKHNDQCKPDINHHIGKTGLTPAFPKYGDEGQD